MRKLTYITAIICICLAVSLGLSTPKIKLAQASTTYRRIITEDTPFYSDPLGTDLLFYLPYTYYVKVLSSGENFSHVECFGTGNTIAIDGYVPTQMLFDDGLPVQNPYMEKEITTISTAVLYLDKGLSQPLQYIFSSRQLKYYGQMNAGDNSVIFYVGYNNRLGYVLESQIMPFELPIHPNELTFLQPDPPLEEEQPLEQTPETDNLLAIRIIVIVCLLLAGLVALFIAIKNKPKKSPAPTYYDENEYE